MRKRSVLSLTPPNERSIKTPPKVKTAFFLDVIKNSENVFQARLVVLQQELFLLGSLDSISKQTFNLTAAKKTHRRCRRRRRRCRRRRRRRRRRHHQRRCCRRRRLFLLESNQFLISGTKTMLCFIEH